VKRRKQYSLSYPSEVGLTFLGIVAAGSLTALVLVLSFAQKFSLSLNGVNIVAVILAFSCVSSTISGAGTVLGINSEKLNLQTDRLLSFVSYTFMFSYNALVLLISLLVFSYSPENGFVVLTFTAVLLGIFFYTWPKKSYPDPKQNLDNQKEKNNTKGPQDHEPTRTGQVANLLQSRKETIGS
jgi:lysylphosphatidylglycerol synthetase-like protein (DUF2156 family)